MSNLRMLCQIERVKHNDVESLLFEAYAPEKKVSVTDLANSVGPKLSLGEQEALLFARYLVEPREDEMVRPDA